MVDVAKIAELNEQFASPGKVRIVPGNNGLVKIQFKAESAKGEIYLHGAQITSWQPAGLEEVLFLSQKSNWEEGKAVRGGIPVCFPWFRAKADDAHAPAHGFVRTKEWELQSISFADDDSLCARFITGSDESSRRWWPLNFQLAYVITVGKILKLELTMTNTSERELRFEEALHTYFAVGDVRSARVLGLDGTAYLDNREGNREKIQQGELVPTKQIDNAYNGALGPVEILDPILGRRLRTCKENSGSTIVWNPWSEGTVGMTDFGLGEWQSMLCVEGGNILSSAITLKPGEVHVMTINISAVAATEL